MFTSRQSCGSMRVRERLVLWAQELAGGIDQWPGCRRGVCWSYRLLSEPYGASIAGAVGAFEVVVFIAEATAAREVADRL